MNSHAELALLQIIRQDIPCLVIDRLCLEWGEEFAPVENILQIVGHDQTEMVDRASTQDVGREAVSGQNS
jgi:hypothetical protein